MQGNIRKRYKEVVVCAVGAASALMVVWLHYWLNNRFYFIDDAQSQFYPALTEISRLLQSSELDDETKKKVSEIYRSAAADLQRATELAARAATFKTDAETVEQRLPIIPTFPQRGQPGSVYLGQTAARHAEHYWIGADFQKTLVTRVAESQCTVREADGHTRVPTPIGGFRHLPLLHR